MTIRQGDFEGSSGEGGEVFSTATSAASGFTFPRPAPFEPEWEDELILESPGRYHLRVNADGWRVRTPDGQTFGREYHHR